MRGRRRGEGTHLVLHANPETIRFGEVLDDEVERILHRAPAVLGILRPHVWELVPGHVGEVVPEEKAAHRMLYALGHFHQVLQNVLGRGLARLDVDGTDRHQEIKPREHHAAALNLLVELRHRFAVTLQAHEEVFEVPELI